MFYVTFKWVDKKLINMSDDERRAFMDALNSKAQQQIEGKIPQEPPPIYNNPFPKWYRDAIKALPLVEGVQFDSENAVYTFQVDLDDDDMEDWALDTIRILGELVAEDAPPEPKSFLARAIETVFGGARPEPEQVPLAERKAWAADNHVQFSYTKGNEEELLADLDAHMHGQSSQGRGGTMGSVELPKLVNGNGEAVNG